METILNNNSINKKYTIREYIIIYICVIRSKRNLKEFSNKHHWSREKLLQQRRTFSCSFHRFSFRTLVHNNKIPNKICPEPFPRAFKGIIRDDYQRVYIRARVLTSTRNILHTCTGFLDLRIHHLSKYKSTYP